jgi:hypothetical protein
VQNLLTLQLISYGCTAVLALSLFMMLRAISRVAGYVTWEKFPSYVLNRFMPNADDRDTAYDYVDRRAWVALASAEMWGALAGLSSIALVVSKIS